MKHVIADISYQQDRILCSCGLEMRATALEDEWRSHRLAEGQALRSLGNGAQRVTPKRCNWSLGRRS